jgi:methionyl-tRNA formyltransferase
MRLTADKMKVVFMGTPEFAVGVLDAIINNDQFDVVGVVTASDKPAGRGKKLNMSAVKKYALQKELPILQPTRLKSEVFLQELEDLKADIFVVVAFRMLPEVVWKMPPLGTFNLHASLLPAYRGAAPINWAIINGETKTGVTTFFIDEAIDTGAILLQREVNIEQDETAGTLHDKLMEAGRELTVETLKKIKQNNIKPKPQPKIAPSHAPKLHKENTKIDWSKSGKEIEQFIRGLSPYPVAWTEIDWRDQAKTLKIYNAIYEQEAHALEVKSILATKKTMKIVIKDGFIDLKEIQLPGKKRMPVRDFLNGLTWEKSIRIV